MNCRRFQDRLFEYVEGTLSAGELAAAQEHLGVCAICRRAVQAEQQQAQVLSTRLRQASEHLTLRPEIMRNVLRDSRVVRRDFSESIAGLWMRWLRLAIVPVYLLLIAACVLAFHFFRMPHRQTTPVAVATHSSSNEHPTVSLEISYHVPVYEFRQEGNSVVDSFVDETVVARAALPFADQNPDPQQLQIKDSL